MILYRPYSLIPSTRLTGERQEMFARVDWVCYFRDEPLVPYPELIQNYLTLEESGEDMPWIHKRANNFLCEAEVEELREYLEKKYEFSVEIEKYHPPISMDQLAWFKEKYADSSIILSDLDEPFTLSISIIGIISPFKDLTEVRTVEEFIREVDKISEK